MKVSPQFLSALDETRLMGEAADYLRRAKQHSKEAERAKNHHTLFRGEPGALEKQMATRNRKLAAAHTAAAAACMQIHDAIKDTK